VGDGETPVRATSVGANSVSEDIRETPDTQQSLFEFPSFSLVWEHMIGCGIGPWQREHGCEFHGENGLLVVDRAGWEVYAETDLFRQPERVFRMLPQPRRAAAGDFHLAHIKNFVACLGTREVPVGDVSIGHASISVLHLANISYRVGRSIRWDAKREGHRRSEAWHSPAGAIGRLGLSAEDKQKMDVDDQAGFPQAAGWGLGRGDPSAVRRFVRKEPKARRKSVSAWGWPPIRFALDLDQTIAAARCGRWCAP
jgi:hypothetical protein